MHGFHTHELKLLRLNLDVRTVDPLLYPVWVRRRIRRDNSRAYLLHGWFDFARLAKLENRAGF